MAFQAADQKKEDFRKYLENHGIVDALAKVLVGLYEEPEKPDNPIEFIKQFLGGPSEVDVEALRHENEELKRQVEELTEKLQEATEPKSASAAGALEGAGSHSDLAGAPGASASGNAASTPVPAS